MPATATFIRFCCSTSANADQVARVLVASGEILDECIACGGSVTGEHGIGVEKISFMRKLFQRTTWTRWPASARPSIRRAA